MLPLRTGPQCIVQVYHNPIATRHNFSIVLLGAEKGGQIGKSRLAIQGRTDALALEHRPHIVQDGLELLFGQQPGHLTSHEQLVYVLQEALFLHLRISEPQSKWR